MSHTDPSAALAAALAKLERADRHFDKIVDDPSASDREVDEASMAAASAGREVDEARARLAEYEETTR